MLNNCGLICMGTKRSNFLICCHATARVIFIKIMGDARRREREINRWGWVGPKMLIAKEKREHDKFMIIHLNFLAFLAGKERDGATRRKAITNTSSTSLEELYWGFMGRWRGEKTFHRDESRREWDAEFCSFCCCCL